MDLHIHYIILLVVFSFFKVRKKVKFLSWALLLMNLRATTNYPWRWETSRRAKHPDHLPPLWWTKGNRIIMSIHMTGTLTNPMSVDLRLWKEDRFSICPYLTLVRIMGPLLLYILNCSNTLTLNKNLAFMILRLLLVLVSYWLLSFSFCFWMFVLCFFWLELLFWGCV